MNWFKRLDRGRQVALGFVTIAGALGLIGSVSIAIAEIGWNSWAEPKVQKSIDCRLDPVEETLRFQNFILMQSLDSSALTNAISSYERDRKMRERGMVR